MLLYTVLRSTIPLDQWFLTMLEVLNPVLTFICAFTEPFVIGKIK